MKTEDLQLLNLRKGATAATRGVFMDNRNRVLKLKWRRTVVLRRRLPETSLVFRIKESVLTLFLKVSLKK